MADIFEMLKEAGVEIPADKKDAFNKEFRRTYKSEGEISKVTEKLEADRDNWKQRAETAEETLKKFDGVNLETMQTELATWKQKAETAQAEYDKKIAERDFEDILKSAISEAKGRNEKAIRANLDIEKLMKSRNQREDVKKALEDLKGAEDTAFMFVDEKQEQLEAGRAKPFTGLLNPNGGGAKKMTREEIVGMKDMTARRQAIAENLSQF
ncbi:MAG: hypothetical protein HFI03_14340 [Lachnospiraceae bacterium]|nr:hypothetical protein [Lachnospiraceae bacterium]